MNVERAADGTWSVLCDGAVVVSGLPNNASAWREADRLTRRPNWKTASNEYRMGHIERESD